MSITHTHKNESQNWSFLLKNLNQIYGYPLQEIELPLVLENFGIRDSDLTPSEVVLRILGEDVMYGLYSKNNYLPLELFDNDALDER